MAMVCKPRWRLSSASFVLLNGILLLINAVLLISSTAYKLRAEPALSENAKIASQLHMDIVYDEKPVMLLVDPEFAQTNRVMLFDDDRQLLFTTKRSDTQENNGASHVFDVAVGEELSMHCEFSTDGGKFHQLSLSTKEWAFTDLDADGQNDVRIDLAAHQAENGTRRNEVWFESQWREATLTASRRATLADGRTLRFEGERGWVVE